MSEDLYEQNIEYVYEDGSFVYLAGTEYLKFLTPREKARVWPGSADEEFYKRYCENPEHHQCRECGKQGMGDASWDTVFQFYCEVCDDIRHSFHSLPSDSSCGKEYEWHRDIAPDRT